MKTLGMIGLFAVAMGAFACSATSSGSAVGTAEGAATTGATADVIVCSSAGTQVGVLAKGLVTMTKTGALYALGSDKTTALALNADKTSGTYGGQTLSCVTASATDAPGWIAAGQMADYADSISGLAESIFEEEAEGDDDGAKKASTDSAAGYVAFAIETANVASLDLGTEVKDSKGALAGGNDDAGTLYDDDNGYAGLSAAYDLGDGDDWGEYFQGMSDGVSIPDSLGDTRATYAAYENTKAFDGLLQSTGVSAVEVTVGAWTFFAPSDFAKSK